MEKVFPTDNRVLILIAEGEKMKGTLYLPHAEETSVKRGTVVEVGPGKLNEQGKWIVPKFRKGQTVLVGNYSGYEVELDGNKMRIISADDIIAIVEEKENVPTTTA